MSRKANAWDIAPMESFFKTLKVERIHQVRYGTRAQARLDIVDWIEGWTTVGACIRPTASSPLYRGRQIAWLHDLLYAETRQGQGQ